MYQLKLVSGLIALSLITVSATSFADNNRGAYLGAGFSAINNDTEFSYNSPDIWTTELILGYKYNNLAGFEIRYGSGSTEHTEKEYLYINDQEIIAENTLLEINDISSVFYRLEAINETGRFYGLIGYSELDLAIEGVKQTIEDTSWGLGLGFFMAPDWNLNFEYKHMADIGTTKLTSITASIDYRF